ncbi:hypothetical protein ACQJBY_044342 [Aegilops geniculata]
MGSARCADGRLWLLFLIMLAVADFGAAQQNQNPPPPGGQYYTNFSPSMAIVIVVLIAAFFFLGFFSVYIRHCYGDSPYSATTLPVGAGAAARSRRQQRGLDPAVLETFPTMAYADVKEHKAVKGALECAVCISEFDDDETLRLLPKCSHVFHPDCIDTWLASHVTCPVCRANLVPDGDGDAPAAGDQPAELSGVHPAPQPQELPASEAEAAHAVVIDVEESEDERIIREETDELTRIGSLKRALRSKSSRGPARFPRSHSTGHSLATRASTGAGAGAERFTLRLPESVLREVVAAGKLRRTKSLVAFTAGRQGSMRRALRLGAGGGDGSSRGGRSVRLGQSGRWPSFLSRTFSAAWGSRSTRRAESDGSSKGGKPAGAGGKSVECNDQACAAGQRV